MFLYQEPYFMFSFAEARRIQRIHLEGIPAGTTVFLHLDPNEKSPLLARGLTDDKSWVTLDREITVAAGDCFYAFPKQIA